MWKSWGIPHFSLEGKNKWDSQNIDIIIAHYSKIYKYKEIKNE
jgi:hypothetical protein